MGTLILTLTLVMIPFISFAQDELSSEQWREDLRTMAEELPLQHEAYLENGEKDLAVASYEEAVRLDPGGRIGVIAAGTLEKIRQP